MAPSIPGVAADIPGNGTPPSGGGGLKNQQHFRQCTGSWGVVYWSGAGFVRRRKMASYCVYHPWYQLIQYSWREGDGLWPNWSCSVQGSRMVGASHRGWVLVSRIRLHSYTATHLDCYCSCPGKSIAYTTWALRGHTESAKEQWKNHHYPKQYSYSDSLTEKPVVGKTKRNGKESLSDKQSTQQLPFYAKMNLNVNW